MGRMDSEENGASWGPRFYFSKESLRAILPSVRGGRIAELRNATFRQSLVPLRTLITSTFLSVAAFVWPELAARAEISVTVDHNDQQSANADFRFKTVPVPRQNAAAGAAFKLLDGDPDPNGASADVLHDGKVSGEEDEPEANFFFRAGGNGGRLLMDLGKVIPVKEIDTYSWHSDVRAPQVYKLYGSDGSGNGFVRECRRPQDPAGAGWKLVADVDTRRKFGAAGGQYGVNVADPAGIVGNYRYLLFDVSRTEESDYFGHTFYTEFNVIDRDAPPGPALVRSAKEPPTTYNQKGIQLTFTSDAPSFDPKEKERLVQTFFAVYPPMMEAFNKDAPRAAKISIETKYRGVAATAGNTIHVNPDWFRRNPEDIDVITHEGMHVVQQYRQWNPGWLTEGIADYARYKFGVNNPAADWTLPDYDAKQSYSDAYRVTARFLVWLEKNVKPGLVVTLNQSMHDGTYKPEVWKQQTGKTVEELWKDYGNNPAL